MSDGSGLTFSFQGEGLVIPPRPTHCNGCDEPTGLLASMRPYRVKFEDGLDLRGEPQVQVVWWCSECLLAAPAQEELFNTIHLIQEDGSHKLIFDSGEGVWHLKS